MQMPVFLVLFLAPVYVPLALLSGWVHAVAHGQPVHGADRGRPRPDLRRRRPTRCSPTGSRSRCCSPFARLGGARAAARRARRLAGFDVFDANLERHPNDPAVSLGTTAVGVLASAFDPPSVDRRAAAPAAPKIMLAGLC